MVTGIKEEVCIVVLAWIGEVVKLQKRSGEWASTRMASMQQPTSSFPPERLPERMPGYPGAKPVLCAASHRARRRTEQPPASRQDGRNRHGERALQARRPGAGKDTRRQRYLWRIELEVGVVRCCHACQLCSRPVHVSARSSRAAQHTASHTALRKDRETAVRRCPAQRSAERRSQARASAIHLPRRATGPAPLSRAGSLASLLALCSWRQRYFLKRRVFDLNDARTCTNSWR
jgi:hypothetical protein